MPKIEQKITNKYNTKISREHSIRAASNPSELSQNLSGKTNINGVIDDFKQGTTGDCYLLTQLKNLSRKSWGKKIIKKSIKPDGMGGAYVTFAGAKTPQKEFHVSVEEILNVRDKQNSIDYSKYGLLKDGERARFHEEYMRKSKYSKGDDDVLVIELAYEKYMKQMQYDGIDTDDINIHSHDFDNMKTKSLKDTIDIRRSLNAKRIGGVIMNADKDFVNLICDKEVKMTMCKNPVAVDALFEGIRKDINNYVVSISFKQDNDLGLLSKHAYEVVGIKKDKCGHSFVILANPWDSSKLIKMSYYDVISSLHHVTAWENPEKPTDLFESWEVLRTITDKKKAERLDSLRNTVKTEHEKCLEKEQEEKLRRKIDKEYKKFSNIIKNENKEERIQNIKNYLKLSDETDTIQMLKIRCSDIIKEMDDAEWGWGHGKDKKALMMPLISYVKEIAQAKGVSSGKINEFEEKCIKELDAIFYTNEKNIIEAFQDILNTF